MVLKVYPLKENFITSDDHALQLMAVALNSNIVFTQSSFQVSVVSGGTLSVSAGTGMINGCFIQSTTSETLSTDQTQTRHIYIQLVRDSNSKPISTQYVVTTSPTYDNNPYYLKLAIVSGTTVTDVRRVQQTPSRYDLFRITATTSTTINFPQTARIVFAKVRALGGGQGGKRGAGYYGGEGGGYTVDRVIVGNVNSVTIAIGAGGDSRNTNGHGLAGGNTIVSIGSVSVTALGGSTTFRSFNRSNYYGINLNTHFSISQPEPSSHWTFVPSPYYTSPFSSMLDSGISSSYNHTRFFGGGHGGYGNSSGQPSALVWGGAGGTASASGTAGNGQVQAGGGGNTDTGTSGAGARGEAIVEMIVVY